MVTAGTTTSVGFGLNLASINLRWILVIAIGTTVGRSSCAILVLVVIRTDTTVLIDAVIPAFRCTRKDG
jgi:hypothetical protein